MRLAVLPISVLCACSLAAHADTIFNLENTTLTNGVTVSGTVDINTTSGVFDTSDIMLTQGATSYVFSAVSFQQSNFNSTQSFAYFSDGTGDFFIVDVPVASLVAYSGSSLCSVSMACGGYVSGFVPQSGPGIAVSTGSLATAATPEPSSFVLLGSGILGAAGVIRRRLA